MEIVTSEQITEAIESAFETTLVQVQTYEGQDHFTAIVVSPEFAGRSRVQQHQMVYAPLKEHMNQAIHALELTTWTPLEWEDKQKGDSLSREEIMRNQEDKLEKKDK